MISAVIIDDEEHMRVNLLAILDANINSVKVIGQGSSVASGTRIIQETNPDLVFLDINLHDGSGFNILEELVPLNFKVIFVTAYSEFAIKAFRYNALDYILKPINVTELNRAISKMKEPTTPFVTRKELHTIIQDLHKKDEERKLIIRNNNLISYLPVADILRCESDGNYTAIFMNNGERTVASKPIKEYDSLLPGSLFYRVHQSHLINLKKVKQYSSSQGDFIIMNDGSIIPLARRRKDEFFEKLNHFT